MAQLVRAPARKAGDPGSNPGLGENFSLKLTSQRKVEKTNVFVLNNNMSAVYFFLNKIFIFQ